VCFRTGHGTVIDTRKMQMTSQVECKWLGKSVQLPCARRFRENVSLARIRDYGRDFLFWYGEVVTLPLSPVRITPFRYGANGQLLSTIGFVSTRTVFSTLVSKVMDCVRSMTPRKR